MNKRIKTTSIIFNVLCLVGTILNFVIAIDAINIKHAEDLSSLGLIALLPIFLIVLFCMVIFSIVQLALFLKAKHVAKENQASLLLYEKFLGILPLVLTIITAILFGFIILV